MRVKRILSEFGSRPALESAPAAARGQGDRDFIPLTPLGIANDEPV